jgi:hypothetical protein
VKDVTEKTCDRILKAADDMAQKLGFSAFSEGIEEAFKWIEDHAEELDTVRNRDRLRNILLNEAPEPNAVELQLTLRSIQTLPFLLRKWLPKMAKELPADPGGHPKSLTPERAL